MNNGVALRCVTPPVKSQYLLLLLTILFVIRGDLVRRRVYCDGFVIMCLFVCVCVWVPYVSTIKRNPWSEWLEIVVLDTLPKPSDFGFKTSRVIISNSLHICWTDSANGWHKCSASHDCLQILPECGGCHRILFPVRNHLHLHYVDV